MRSGVEGTQAATPRGLVLDTNIVLDLFVFDDARTVPLLAHIEQGEAQWLATPAMREELARVLGYPHIESKLAYYALQAADVLARFDRHAQIVEPAARAPVTCADADDQKFIDLAVAHQCVLLSKDREVLTLSKRLALFNVLAAPQLAASSG